LWLKLISKILPESLLRMSIAFTDRCAVLRSELKQWEAHYAAANGGKKAGRDEIKKDAAIGMYG